MRWLVPVALALLASALWLLQSSTARSAGPSAARRAPASAGAPPHGVGAVPSARPRLEPRIAVEAPPAPPAGAPRGARDTEADGAVLEVRVHTWYRDRSPRGHAFVLVHAPEGDGPAAETIVAEGCTDREGRGVVSVDLDGHPGMSRGDTYVVRVTEPRFVAADARVRWTRHAGVGPGRARIRPVPGFLRRVRAVDPEGTAVSADFSLEGADLEGLARAARRKPVEVLDDGTARVAVMGGTGGALVVSSSRHGIGRVAYADLHAAGPSDEPFTVTLAPGPEVSGTLIGAHGAPLGGVALLLTRVPGDRGAPEEPPHAVARRLVQTTTAADGSFRVCGLARGSYAITPPFSNDTSRLVEAERASPPVTIQVELAWVDVRVPVGGSILPHFDVFPMVQVDPEGGPDSGRHRCLMAPGQSYSFEVTERSGPAWRIARTTVTAPTKDAADVLEIAGPAPSVPWESIPPEPWR